MGCVGDGGNLFKSQDIAKTNRLDSTPEGSEDYLGKMRNAKGD